MASVYRKSTGLFASAFFVPLLPCGIAHMARFTKGKGWRVIAFLRVPVAMDVGMDILPLEKIFGGVSKCPRNICAETAVTRLYTVQREIFEGENFHGFRGSRAIRKSFLRGIWERTALTYGWFQATSESFLHEILTSYGSAKFSPLKVYRYTV